MPTIASDVARSAHQVIMKGFVPNLQCIKNFLIQPCLVAAQQPSVMKFTSRWVIFLQNSIIKITDLSQGRIGSSPPATQYRGCGLISLLCVWPAFFVFQFPVLQSFHIKQQTALVEYVHMQGTGGESVSTTQASRFVYHLDRMPNFFSSWIYHK